MSIKGNEQVLKTCELQEEDSLRPLQATLTSHRLVIRGETSADSISLKHIHHVSARYVRRLGASAIFVPLLCAPILVSGAVYGDSLFLSMMALAAICLLWNICLLAIGQTVLSVSFSGGHRSWRKLGRNEAIFEFARTVSDCSMQSTATLMEASQPAT